MKDFKRKSEELNALQQEFADDDYNQNQDDLKALLQLPSFRRVLINIIKRARVFGSISYESADTNIVMKAIGFRELGVDIYMSANKADGEMVLKAISERNELERDRKVRYDVLLNKMKGNGK